MANLIGTKPNQVPTNGSLGTMAFQDKEEVTVDNLTVETVALEGTDLQTTLDDILARLTALEGS